MKAITKTIIQRTSLAMVLLAMVSCASVNRVTVDYSKRYDFRSVKTFSYLETVETNAKSRVVDQGIERAIKARLTTDGLTEVNRDENLIVTYHLVTKDRPLFSTRDPEGGSYGDWGPGWGRWGYGGPNESWRRWEYEGPGLPTSRAYETVYPVGTLILDAVNPVTRTLLWRGTGKVDINDGPSEQLQQAERIVKIVSDRWQGILTGMSR